jgi:hypothetical protein
MQLQFNEINSEINFLIKRILQCKQACIVRLVPELVFSDFTDSIHFPMYIIWNATDSGSSCTDLMENEIYFLFITG